MINRVKFLFWLSYYFIIALPAIIALLIEIEINHFKAMMLYYFGDD